MSNARQELQKPELHADLVLKTHASFGELGNPSLDFGSAVNLYFASDGLAVKADGLSLDERTELMRIAVATTDRLLELGGEERRANVDSTRMRARNRLAEFLLASGDIAEAIEVAEAALDIDSERVRPDLLETLVKLYLARNDHALALRTLDEWAPNAEKFPLDYAEKRARLYLGLGLTNEALRWVDQALQNAEEFLSSRGDKPLGAAAADLVRIHATAANLDLEIGDWSGALDTVRSALAEQRFFDQRSDLRVGLLRLEGVAWTHLERTREGLDGKAEDAFARGLALDPAPVQRLRYRPLRAHLAARL